MKPSLKAEVNKFTKGIITEASELAFPGDASFDEENFVLTTKGIRKRRLGIQYEGVFSNVYTTGSFSDRFIWKSPSADTSKTFVVIAFHDSLSFYDNAVSPLSSGFIATLNITSLGTGYGSSWRGFRDTKMSSVDGRLIVVRGTGSIGVVEYTGSGFTLSTGRLLVRDQWGVAEATDSDPSIRPSTLTATHYYNLQNQSWGIPRRGTSTSTEDAVTIFHTEFTSEYPSNSDVVWTSLQFAPVASGTDPYERVYPKLFKESYNGGLPSAKGYFVIDLLTRGVSREAAYLANVTKYSTFSSTFASVDLPDDSTTGGPTLLAAMSGRMFYAGFTGTTPAGDARTPSLNNCVVFSQVIKNKDDTFKCYQEGDPTSRENADIVDTDGGFIKIAETNIIRGLANYDDSLIVFGDQGIWRMSGGGEYGFTASNYKSKKLSDKVLASPDSIVMIDGGILFWAMDGIYFITKNQMGDTVVNNLTTTTIQSLYADIPENSLYGSVGTYCHKDKIVRWVYSKGGNTYELCFNVAYSAFTKSKLYGMTGKTLATIFTQTELSTPTYLFVENIFEEGVSFGKAYKFAKMTSETFQDFSSDAFAYLQTGSQTASDSSVDKQIPYIVMHFVRTEEGVDAEGVPLKQSGCLARCKWGWSESSVSNKWSRLFQAYRERKPLFSGVDYETGFNIVTSKSKLRGRGKAFSVYFETEPGKDCQPVGWSLTVNGNANT